ncbi:MAG TPA: cyanophycinase [Candidatus Eisenbacteria bacterium]|nr:cyanophycinase [Candidatus Eisenbacteria bacterium]
MSPSRVPEGQQRGFIVPIGGAEDKLGDEAILKRFVRLCGKREARIAVIPTASELRSTGRRYEELFRDLKAAKVWVLPFESRKQCEDREELAVLEKANGIFLTGGNQVRLGTTLGGTPVAKALRLMNASGAHVAGTSAGAAFLSEHMIAFGDEGSTPRAGMVSLAPGLGLTNRVVVDQHFRQRDRLGRLLAALAYNPFAHGVGLDEDTAAFIGPDDTLEVVGSGAVTIVDPAEMEYSSMDQAKLGEPVTMIGVKIHVLVSGARYNLHERRATAIRAEADED